MTKPEPCEHARSVLHNADPHLALSAYYECSICGRISTEFEPDIDDDGHLYVAIDWTDCGPHCDCEECG